MARASQTITETETRTTVTIKPKNKKNNGNTVQCNMCRGTGKIKKSTKKKKRGG